MGCPIWRSEHDEYIWRLHQEGKSHNTIAKAVSKKFKISRRASAVETRIYVIKRIKRSDDAEAEQKGGERTDTFYITTAMEEFDRQNLRPVLQKREDRLYALLTEYAKAIRAYDILRKYGNRPVREILNLDPSAREELKGVLYLDIRNPDVSTIPIVINEGPFYGGNLSIVLPVHLRLVEGASNEGLVSLLNDAAFVVMVSDLGFKPTSPSRDRFRDLVKYNFTHRPFSYTDLEKALTEHIRGSNSDVKCVSLIRGYAALNNPVHLC